MSEIDDAAEWAQAAESYDGDKSNNKVRARDRAPDFDDDDNVKNPGQPNQYALYGPGFMATTPTIKTLPPGCYDIQNDNRGVFVVPALAPSGLLLELPEMRSEEVIRVVDNFWNSEGDYKDGNQFVVGGAQFKAGVMIYGPPGSGKSCTIKLVSRKLIERGGTVFFSSGYPAVTMRWLEDFARVENNRKSIVILEDIDSLIANYGESNYLEMLDSAKTINNVLFIATTNYPEHLDPRIYNRPGRFSHVIKIGLPTDTTREAYLKAILKDHRDVEEIVRESKGFTIDHLTALVNGVYREKKNLATELKRLRTLFRVPKSDGDGRAMGIRNGDD
ncbi:MAG: ATP-binding protein [Leptolyngbyaceae cyanobacterium RM2_2_4]|nr:ATP-binding protein [Leptolyngbyaceae cyanobacterium RM2_2_4]